LCRSSGRAWLGFVPASRTANIRAAVYRLPEKAKAGTHVCVPALGFYLGYPALIFLKSSAVCDLSSKQAEISVI
jgi:hypothetical protein